MSFSIDKQTLEELNLPGKFRNDSVYSLFNKVKTSGGERLLHDLFSTPMTDASSINTRTAVFRFFQEKELTFPFDLQQVDSMRDYLDTVAQKSRVLTLGHLLIKKGLSLLTRDERYRKDVQGLQATIGVLNTCVAFIEKLGAEGPYADRTKKIRDILTDHRILALRSIDIYTALSLKKLAHYEYLLKSSLADEIAIVQQFIYEIDVYIAVSTVARTKNFTYAHALPGEKKILSATGLCHPCVEKAVGNSISMNQNSHVLFLTGANMAGKSTLMKSIGIAMYLAHTGFPVAAESFEFSVRDGLYSSINVADNIGLGYSHFYAEVIRVKQAAEAVASGKNLLLLFDELFKGTNVKDAYDGTLAVTEAFAAYDNCLFIVSTHIIEVGEALKCNNNVRFFYMPTVMEGARPRYTYRLQQGITEDRQGMMIIRNEGILELLKNAYKKAVSQ